jgi:hypothetical protein
MIHVSAIAYSQTSPEAGKSRPTRKGTLWKSPGMKRPVGEFRIDTEPAVLIRKWKKDF